jgi:O-antigen biosynthesis protein
MDCRAVFVSQCGQDYFTGIAGSAEQQKRYEGLLYAAGVERVVYGPEEAEYLIRELGSELRWAFLSFPNVADQFIPRIRAHAPWATVMYDMVDFHSLRKSREANLRSDAALQAEAERMRQIELTNAKAADVTVAISDSERPQLLAIDPNLVLEVIPNVFDLPINARLQIDGRSGLLFVGGFQHPPNLDAVLWFVHDIWPRILSQDREMVLRIVGSDLSEGIVSVLKQPGVEVLGYVPDLTGLFAYSRMSVAPLRYGAGVKGKVGQSIAYGLPVVTTKIVPKAWLLKTVNTS